MKTRLLRDPLTHFLLGGALLFGLYALVGGSVPDAADRIVVSEARVESLAATFERTWMRPPTQDELHGLVHDYVVEEALYREALELGLDRDDLIVRRRMRQKMEFLSDELAATEPDEAELHAFLDTNAERFEIPGRTSFIQIYLDPGRSGSDPDSRARAWLERLQSQGDAAATADEMGDPTLLPRALADATPNEIERHFGGDFADAVGALPVDAWSGPIRSGLGLHLVRVDQRTAGRTPSLDEVRGSVLRELEAERRQAAQERFREQVLERYEVVLPEALPPVAARVARQ